MIEVLILGAVSIISAGLGAGGFWQYMQSRNTRQTAELRLLKGIAHDRIVFLGMSFVDRGWITHAEYEDFMTYLYDPYEETGGNGLAKLVKDKVSALPMYSKIPTNADD